MSIFFMVQWSMLEHFNKVGLHTKLTKTIDFTPRWGMSISASLTMRKSLSIWHLKWLLNSTKHAKDQWFKRKSLPQISDWPQRTPDRTSCLAQVWSGKRRLVSTSHRCGFAWWLRWSRWWAIWRPGKHSFCHYINVWGRCIKSQCCEAFDLVLYSQMSFEGGMCWEMLRTLLIGLDKSSCSLYLNQSCILIYNVDLWCRSMMS